MDLSKAILRPGKVIEVLENGKIRADVPGLFSLEDKDKLPPILPFPLGHANTYSQPLEYDNVWVLNFKDNPQQLHWFRMDDYENNDAEIIKEENVEVLCNREAGTDWATIYFSDGSEWVIRKGGSRVQIRPDGSILLDMGQPYRAIDIENNAIHIGKKGDGDEKESPAVYGDALEEILVDICGLFGAIRNVALANPYTAAIGAKIATKLPTIQPKIGGILSPHVKIV